MSDIYDIFQKCKEIKHLSCEGYTLLKDHLNQNYFLLKNIQVKVAKVNGINLSRQLYLPDAFSEHFVLSGVIKFYLKLLGKISKKANHILNHIGKRLPNFQE